MRCLVSLTGNSFGYFCELIYLLSRCHFSSYSVGCCHCWHGLFHFFHEEQRYINTVIAEAVGGSGVLSNKQWPAGITCHGSYTSWGCNHPHSPAVLAPPFCLFCFLLSSSGISHWEQHDYLRMLITIIVNHFPHHFWSLQQCTEGGPRTWTSMCLCVWV